VTGTGRQNNRFWMAAAILTVIVLKIPNGGYLKSPVDNAWSAGVSAA
jgi:hypothetical protein